MLVAVRCATGERRADSGRDGSTEGTRDAAETSARCGLGLWRKSVACLPQRRTDGQPPSGLFTNKTQDAAAAEEN